jgi:hypothetical protein
MKLNGKERGVGMARGSVLEGQGGTGEKWGRLLDGTGNTASAREQVNQREKGYQTLCA